ncbi:toll-like receptor 4 [Gigantopelta aegis]|uniref:toll-like receptor 4 n=1 Tax=Gigantopelta aegis TaxID=1735272 RepID=UPI001B888188|nr:toll-like receptor 4 [Gigantopelta aegis]
MQTEKPYSRMNHMLPVIAATILITAAALSSLEPSTEVSKGYACNRCLCKTIRRRLVANCISRNFSSVPDIPNSSLIDVLLLDSNNLRELDAGCFSQYPKLDTLSLTDNVIETIHAGAFLNLQNLQMLNLTGNRLKYYNSIWKNNTFEFLHNLKVLSLSRNADKRYTNQTYPDAALSSVASLEHLYLDGLTNQSFEKGFSKMASLKELSFRNGHCNLQNLFNKTFVNIKQVSHLDLSNCAIEYIAAGAFLPLRNSLTHLDISYNRKLGFDQVGIGAFGWQNSRLQVLNITGIEAEYAICIKITKEHLKHYTNTSIVEIYADENKIEAFEKRALQLLPSSLKKVSVQRERFVAGLYLHDLDSLVGLEEIDISGEKGSRKFPDWEARTLVTKADCLADDEPLCSEFAANQYKVQAMEDVSGMSDTSNSNGHKAIFISLPPNLKTIKMTFRQMFFRISELIILNNSLTEVDFSHNLLTRWIGPIEGLQKLKKLDLSNNFATDAKPSFFRNFHSLLSLNISWNLLSYVIIRDRDGGLFGNMTSLHVLDLSGNTIQKLPPHLLDGLSNLRTLVLSRNFLYSVKVQVKHMKHLKRVDLSYNMLRWLSWDFTSDLDAIADAGTHTVHMDLSYNPISCECANLRFLTWMLNSKVKQRYQRKRYYCLDEHGKNFSLAHLDTVLKSLKDSCTRNFGLTSGISAIVILCLILLLGGFAYRNRWKLRYWYYGARYNYKHINSDEALGNFQYDAFVSYAPEDKQFFDNEMKSNTLEKRLITRDDIPSSEQPLEKIGNLIQQSRKTVLLLSEHFLEDEECKQELQAALPEHLNAKRDLILMILLEGMPREKIPDEIKHLLQTDSYIEYHEDNKDTFWQRFNKAISPREVA